MIVCLSIITAFIQVVESMCLQDAESASVRMTRVVFNGDHTTTHNRNVTLEFRTFRNSCMSFCNVRFHFEMYMIPPVRFRNTFMTNVTNSRRVITSLECVSYGTCGYLSNTVKTLFLLTTLFVELFCNITRIEYSIYVITFV